MILLRLIKYKLSLAVTLTAVVAYIIFKPEFVVNIILLAIGTFLLAGGASALNQYQEREYDSLMTRTKGRPLPTGALKPVNVLEITLIMAIAGSLILLYLSWITALLGIVNMMLYNLVYTKLKRSTYLAIIPGALVGAIPPLMGWTAAGGSPFDIKILFISTLIFMWQIPHFWMLLIRFHKDYEKAGFPTLLKKLSETQVRRIVFMWISLSSLFAMTSYLFGIELNFVISMIIVVLNFTFIVVFFILLFLKRVETRVAFILTNIFITLLYILFAVGSAIK